MKTKLVTPILIEEKCEVRKYPCILKHSYHFGDSRGVLDYCDCNIKTPTKLMRLSIVSLDDDIKPGDKYYDEYSTGAFGIGGSGEIKICTNPKALDEGCYKIMATEDQLSPEYIKKFIEQYNSNNVEDFHIEVSIFWNNKRYPCQPFPDEFATDNDRVYLPKLINGFITIVDNIETVDNTSNEIKYTYDHLKLAYSNGYRYGSKDGMSVARGGELNVVSFDYWFNKNMVK